MAERGDISSSPEGNGSGTPGPALARRLLVAVVVAAAGLSATVAVSSTAAGGAPPRTVDRVESSKPGKAPSIVRELPDQRTATSTTYLTEDGSHVARVFAEPINFRDSDGRFRPIDMGFVDSSTAGYAVRTGANRLIAELPSDASDPVLVKAEGEWARFSLQGAEGRLRQSGKRARYLAALPATDLTFESVPEGLKEALILRDSRAPGRFRYSVDTSSGLRLRESQEGGIEFVDGQRVVFSFEAPFAYDAAEKGHGPADVPAKPRATMRLVKDDPSPNVVEVELDRAWLSDPDRAFPVTLDPTVSYTQDSVKLGGATQDTALSQDTPTTSYSTGQVNDVGFGGLSPAHDHRALLKFDVAGAIPDDSVVFSSTLGMYLERQDTSTPTYLRVREVARDWTNAATWGSYDGTNAWTTPGGDVTSYASAGIQPGIGFNYWKDLHSLAQRWVDRSSPNNGLLVERCCSTANNRYEFTSSEGAQSQWPYLQVWYTQRAGTSRAYSFWQPDGSVTQGNDGDTPGAKSVAPIGVNVATGNLLTRSTDREPDVPESQDVVRWHNSVWWGHSAYGRGASGDGFDVSLWTFPSGNVRFNGPANTPALFVRRADGTFDRATEPDATLTRATDGTGEYTVTMSETGERYVFDDVNNKRAKRYIDGAGNVTTYNMAADAKSVIATDATGRTTTFVRDILPGGGTFLYTKEVRAPEGSWRYGYDVNFNLASVTAPNGQITRYAYQPEAGPGGAVYDKRLTKITATDGSETRFTYTGPWGSRQIASYTTRAPGAATDGPTTRFAYNDGTTTITDPSGRVSTYTWDRRTKRVSRIDVGTAPPTVTPSGPLAAAGGTTLAENDTTTYRLDVNATSAAGVRSIEILVDDEQEDYAEQSCTGCGMARSWTFDPQEFPSGPVTITTIATANNGATQTRRFSVTVGGSTAETAASEELDADETFEIAEPATVLPDPAPGLVNPAAVAAAKANPNPSGPSPQAAQAAGQTTIFDNLRQEGVPPTNRPPDPTGAIGTSRYVQMVNNRIALYDRTNLNVLSGRDLMAFAGAPDVYDPQVVWDPISRRFFYAAAASGGTREGDNYLVFGWSKTASPTNLSVDRPGVTGGQWCALRLRGASRFQDDFPKMAVSRNHIIIGSNVFNSNDPAQNDSTSMFSRLLVTYKPPNGQEACPPPEQRKRRMSRFNNLGVPAASGGTPQAFTPVPVVNSSAASRGGYVLSADPDASRGGIGTRILGYRVVGTLA